MISNSTNYNILVTGGAGFLGSHMCRKLFSLHGEKAFIICVDNFMSGREQNIADLRKNPNFLVINHDVIDPLALNVDHLDEIYHLACAASPPVYQKDPVHTTKTCFLGTLNMLEMAKKFDCKILFSSTSEVYGDPDCPVQKETYRGNVSCNGIRSCYDEGKRVAESLMFDYYRQYKVKIHIVRIFNTYGPMMNPHDGRVVSNFIRQALNNEPITVYGTGEQTRSFCYVSDNIEGLTRLMATDIPDPVNIGNPSEYTILEIAKIIIKATNSTSEIIFQDLPLDDPTRRKPDISKAFELLGWKPVVTLDEGLAFMIEDFKQNNSS